jgi:hypothetical protein
MRTYLILILKEHIHRSMKANSSDRAMRVMDVGRYCKEKIIVHFLEIEATQQAAPKDIVQQEPNMSPKFYDLELGPKCLPDTI